MKQNTSIDFTRSVLILLVILVHIVYFGDMYPSIKSDILSFMMPSFLFITGYLANVDKSLSKFLLYIWKILLPYIILVVGYTVCSTFLPVRDGVHELTLSVLLNKVFITSIGPYWFLYVMVGCGIAYYASFKFLFCNKDLIFRLLCFSILLIVFSLFLPLMAISTVMYYFFGVVVRQLNIPYCKFIYPSFFGIPIFAILMFFIDGTNWLNPLVILSVYAFLSFSSWIRNILSMINKITYFDWIGKNTLPIYLFHPIFTMVSKFYHHLFTWDNSNLLFTIVTLFFSVICSLFLAYILDKTHLTFIFARKYFFR